MAALGGGRDRRAGFGEGEAALVEHRLMPCCSMKHTIASKLARAPKVTPLQPHAARHHPVQLELGRGAGRRIDRVRVWTPPNSMTASAPRPPLSRRNSAAHSGTRR